VCQHCAICIAKGSSIFAGVVSSPCIISPKEKKKESWTWSADKRHDYYSTAVYEYLSKQKPRLSCMQGSRHLVDYYDEFLVLTCSSRNPCMLPTCLHFSRPTCTDSNTPERAWNWRMIGHQIKQNKAKASAVSCTLQHNQLIISCWHLTLLPPSHSQHVALCQRSLWAPRAALTFVPVSTNLKKKRFQHGID
jgi:hypothetical protein